SRTCTLTGRSKPIGQGLAQEKPRGPRDRRGNWDAPIEVAVGAVNRARRPARRRGREKGSIRAGRSLACAGSRGGAGTCSRGGGRARGGGCGETFGTPPHRRASR